MHIFKYSIYVCIKHHGHFTKWLKITVNGEAISTDTSSSVYLSNKMDNGGTSNDATSSNIEVSNIININSAGTYEFSGILTDGQISVNTNNIVGEKIKQSVESLED